ncbi:TetR/AcrR family transcriptional regulator [Gordonia sp. NPDC003424]
MLTATELFERRGYRVTISEIADAAGVSPETIYKSFGGKAGLIKEAFDQAVAGDDEKVVVRERPENRAIDDEPDVRRKLEMYAATATARIERSARLQLVIRDGAEHNASLDKLWRTALDQRLYGMNLLAEHLVGSGGLRAELTVEHVRDTLWTLIAPEIYELLVLDRGWSIDAYRDWITRAMIAELT